MNISSWTISRQQDPGPEEGGNIHERNGIWVVTINNVWHGDYVKREHAVAAVKAAENRAW